MIARLSSPSVCVIDDEIEDYQPILNALLKLGIGCIHINGGSAFPLPPEPFKGLRIVFTDLYLSGSTGKTAAAHTANVFKAVVSADTAPILVIIWSKHTNDLAGDIELPPEDEPTISDLFKAALLEAEPKYRERLIFATMAKPKLQDRPDASEWTDTLQLDISNRLKEFPACDMLWSWESLIRSAGLAISEELTSLALQCAPADAEGVPNESLDAKLSLIFRALAKEQGGPDCNESSAPRHLAVVLAQTLVDELEHSSGLESLSHHGKWLCDQKGIPKTLPFASHLNGLLLTAAVPTNSGPFVPGTVYKVKDSAAFTQAFGVPAGELIFNCYKKVEEGEAWTSENWKERAVPVVAEISPVCDFHQKTRRQALLIAGLLVPSAGRNNAKRGDAFETLPVFNLRWGLPGFSVGDYFLTFCSRYKLTIIHKQEPEWLTPWFRLRDLPTAALRNWHSSHSSRVGFVSLR